MTDELLPSYKFSLPPEFMLGLACKMTKTG